MKLSLILSAVFTLQVSASVFSQQIKINQDTKGESVRNVLRIIEKESNVRFFYNDEFIQLNEVMSKNIQAGSLENVLNTICSSASLTYKIMDNNFVVIYPLEMKQAHRINGTVTDGSTKEPVPGVNIVLEGTTIGAITGMDGRFSIDVPDSKSVLIFSSVGYLTERVTVGENSTLNISLLPDIKALEEIVVVGYGTQRKATLTGAISSVKGDDIVTTKNENAQNMLAGKISGVRVTQKTAEPGAFNNNFDIRAMGAPLIIIDGIPRTNDDFQRLDPNDIENLSVLKDASAAVYGFRGANGVVLVTTKRGTKDKLELNYSGSYAWQIPSGLPATVDAIEYMTLRNEAAMHNVGGGSPVFNDQQFEDYRTGKKTSTDWYPLVFSNYAPQTMHNLSATGGNDRTTFYAGLGYQYQEGFFKSSDLNYTKYNLRSNITTKITNRLTFDLNLNGVMDQQDRPYQDSWWIIRGFWRQGAHIPAYANNDPTKPYHGLIEGDNPISFMDDDIVGYKKYNKKWLQSSASLKYDIPGIKGLFVKGLFSYDYYVSSANLYQREYNQFRYDEATSTYSKFTRQSPNRIKREAYFKTQMLSQASLNYDGSFDKHKVNALALWEVQKRTSDNFFAQRDLPMQLPYIFAGMAEGQQATMNTGADALYENANLALVGRLNYGFDNKYLAEFLFRYDGSSRFAPGSSQWGFFPAASVGWRVSEEQFFKNISALSFVSNFKIRSSYGRTGDEKDDALKYQFISGYNYPTKSDRRNFTGGYVFDGSYNASADHKGIPNEFLTWFSCKTFDIGFDFEGWNGLFGLSADYFSRHRVGLLDKKNGAMPTVVGAELPEENMNSDRTFGFDLELSHRNKIGEFNYSARGLFSLARVKRLKWERNPIGSSWNNWKATQKDGSIGNQNNRLQGIQWGYTSDGQFQSWEDIYNSSTYVGRGAIVGDYKYEDWNGDGEINDHDKHPIRYNQYPWMNYSLILDASYKGFDLNLLLQGSAMSSLIYGEQLRIPMWGSGDSGAMEQFMDRWHPVDPKADPYDPATQWVSGHYAYTGSLPEEASTFNIENSAYLRLKSIEMGYTLPSKWLDKTGIKNLRIYANTYNLFTITKVRYVDPEHPNDSYGYLYPLNKSVSVGLNIKF